jgi:hypothetical protein
MLRSIWMHPWDLEGSNHAELIAFLKDCGLNACNLAFSYHGGRVFLPRHAQRKVYEQDLSAVYFPINDARYRGLRLRPHVAPQAELVRDFLTTARRADFTVNAWTVLCHNDRLGRQAPDCCITNVFGERYSYALCPAHPDVRAYIVALCADIAATDGIARLDLEALSFMGYEHQSLHDKTGLPLTPVIKWLLSICVCAHCHAALGTLATEVTIKARTYITEYLSAWPELAAAGDLRAELERVLGASELQALLEMRQQTISTLLDEMRAVTSGAHLNLRLATSPLFTGGKTALDWDRLLGRADSVTITFLGATTAQMQADLQRLPIKDERPVPVYGGFAFHYPDCHTAADVQARVDLLTEAQTDGLLFYCYGMATKSHFAWLQNALRLKPR